MNKILRRLTAVLLAAMMLGACAPAMAEGIPTLPNTPGLNGFGWLVEAAAQGKTIEVTNSIDLDTESIAQLIKMFLPAGMPVPGMNVEDQTTAEAQAQMVDMLITAALSLVDSLSVRETFNLQTFQGKTEFLVSGGQVLTADLVMKDSSFYVLTNLLPELALRLDLDKLGAVISSLMAQLPQTDGVGQADGMAPIKLADDTLTKATEAVKAILSQPGTLTAEEGLFELDGVTYSRMTTVSLTQLQFMTMIRDVFEIFIADEVFTQSLYGIVQSYLAMTSAMSNNNGFGSAPPTYEQFMEALAQEVVSLNFSISDVDEPKNVVELTALSGDQGKLVLDLVLTSVSDEVVAQVEHVVNGSSVSLYAGVADVLIGFAGSFDTNETTTALDATIAFCKRPDDAHALSDVMTLATTQQAAALINFKADALLSGDTEDISYALSVYAAGIHVGLNGACTTTREPYEMVSQTFLDLSALGLPQDAIGVASTIRTVDALPVPQTEGLTEIDVLSITQDDIQALQEALTTTGLQTLIINLMTYMPQDAAPLLMLLSGIQ